MPILDKPVFKPPIWLRNCHAQTIYAGLFRPLPEVTYERERVVTPDGDFLDLDWSKIGSNKLVIVLHGLEGNADRPYVRGVVKIMNEAGWDGMGLNFRGCSGESNRLPRAYHSGETEDLDWVIARSIASQQYDSIAIVGFSLGGNVTLKYVGERGAAIAPEVKKAVGVSVPIHLESSSIEISSWQNWPYLRRFLKTLKAKTLAKADILPPEIDLKAVKSAVDFPQFDGAATAPIHGFSSATDYYTRSSSLTFLPEVAIPTLLLNAADDSFLSPRCYPIDLAREHPFLHLQVPDYGGHVGFVQFVPEGYYWSEQQIRDFLVK